MDDKVITVFNTIGVMVVEILNFSYAYCEYCVDHNII